MCEKVKTFVWIKVAATADGVYELKKWKWSVIMGW